MRSAQTFELMTFRHLATTLIPVPVARIALAAGGACELTGMPEAGNGDTGLFQALPGPHSPKLVRYSPTGDSHWATDTTAGQISREVTERQFEQERLARRHGFEPRFTAIEFRTRS